MRIDLTNIQFNGVEREDKTQKARASTKAPITPSVEDKASLSVDTLSLSSLQAKALAAPEIRQDKVEALRQAIQNGDYRVEPDKVARAILDQNNR